MRLDQDEPARQSILLVDDEVLVRHELAEYLRHCGYDVIEAASSDEAKTVLLRASGRVDAVLCRAQIVGATSGFELARLIRTEHPDVPVLLAGSVQQATAVAGDLCDEGPELAPPYDPAAVVDRIKRRMATRKRTRGD